MELDGDCAEVSAPAMSIHAAAAHKKAITSLIIKNMNERSKFSPGPTGLVTDQPQRLPSSTKQSGRTL